MFSPDYHVQLLYYNAKCISWEVESHNTQQSCHNEHTHFCREIRHMIFRKWGGGSKVVWNFSENSYVLVGQGLPKATWKPFHFQSLRSMTQCIVTLFGVGSHISVVMMQCSQTILNWLNTDIGWWPRPRMHEKTELMPPPRSDSPDHGPFEKLVLSAVGFSYPLPVTWVLCESLGLAVEWSGVELKWRNLNPRDLFTLPVSGVWQGVKQW